MRTKSLTDVTIKDVESGTVEAVFARFNVIDKDGDYTEPDAIKDGTPVVISAYGHKSWAGTPPVGDGVVRVRGDVAVLEGQFYLDTQNGRDTFTAVKSLASKGLGEWSYGFSIKDAAWEVKGDQDVYVLKDLDIFEVSPVLRGAGVDTRTLAAKSDSLKTQVDDAVSVVADTLASVRRVAALRADVEKDLSGTIKESLADLDSQLTELKSVLNDKVAGAGNDSAPQPVMDSALMAQLMYAITEE